MSTFRNFFGTWVLTILRESELLLAAQRGPWTSSINVAQQLVRNAESQALPRSAKPEPAFSQGVQVVCVHFTVWEALNLPSLGRKSEHPDGLLLSSLDSIHLRVLHSHPFI